MNKCKVTFKNINFNNKKYDISLKLSGKYGEEIDPDDIINEHSETEEDLWKIYKMMKEYEKEQKKYKNK